MTVRDLIKELLEYQVDQEIVVYMSRCDEEGHEEEVAVESLFDVVQGANRVEIQVVNLE